MPTPSGILHRNDMPALFRALADRGYSVIGPTVRDGAVIIAPLESADDLPAGWTDEQDGGHYHLTRRDDGAVFGHASPAGSWKRYLHPPEMRLWRAQSTGTGFTVAEGLPPPPRQAFLGVRACDLAAIAVQDRVFQESPAPGAAFTDPVYAGRRAAAFIVAVNCGHAGATCFCAALGTGPRVQAAFDLALTELLEGEHRFLVEAGSPAGEAVLADLPLAPAGEADHAARDALCEATAAAQERSLPADHRDLLARHLNDPHWETVAERCLSCGNCTLACPTCFCTTVEDSTSLDGQTAERHRRWDSCFSLEFSYIHGGSIRKSTASRYRQWMTHKLSTWYDQFGTAGCVGCGRCITWCPVGIDITEEAAVFAARDGAEHKNEAPAEG